MNDQQDKIKQREALENAYGNFVEPYVNKWIELNAQSFPTNPWAFPCFCGASGWLVLLILFYYMIMRKKRI